MKAIVNHFEIPSDDLGRAQSFYADVFGWKLDDWGDGNVMVEAGGEGGIGGDIHQRGSEVPHPTFVISVDLIEDAVAAITAKGGQLVSEIQSLQGMGRYAYFKDSEGNLIGLWDDVKEE